MFFFPLVKKKKEKTIHLKIEIPKSVKKQDAELFHDYNAFL